MYKAKMFLMTFVFLGLLLTQIGCDEKQNLKNIYEDGSRISAQGDSYSFGSRVGQTRDNIAEIEYNKFYGSETLFYIDVKKQGEIKVTFESDLDRGKFKAVYITPLEEVVNIFEHSEKEKNPQGTYTINGEVGVYRLKIVGDDARGKLTMKVDLGVGMEMIRYE